MLLFVDGDIGDLFRVDNILIKQPCFFVIGDAYEVNGIPGNFDFYVIITRVFELYLPVDVFKILPVLRDCSMYRNLYFHQVVDIVPVFADLVIKYLVGAVNKILIKHEVTA